MTAVLVVRFPQHPHIPIFQMGQCRNEVKPHSPNKVLRNVQSSQTACIALPAMFRNHKAAKRKQNLTTQSEQAQYLGSTTIYSVQPDGSSVKHMFPTLDALTRHVRALQSKVQDAWMDMNTNPSIQSDGHLGMDWSDTLDKLNGESQSSAPLLLVPAPPTDDSPASRESETKASKLRKR